MSIIHLSQTSHPAGGTLFSFQHISITEKPGTIRNCTLYVPSVHSEKAALQVYFDGMRAPEPAIVEKLIAEKAAPPMVCLGVSPAVYPPSLVGGYERSVRSPEYDSLGSSLADYLIHELIPEVAVILNLSISLSPDMHAICGCSSGGIAAWNACFERNDFFRRCLINSPTFSAFRGGEELPFLIRKFEPRKIKCYMTAGTDDMKNSAGNWYLEALSAKEAMDYAGYDFQFELFQDGKHGVGSADAEVMERGLRFIWKDWETKPVEVLHYPERVADIVSPDTEWEETTYFPPKKCRYTYAGNTILLNGNIMTDTPWTISDMVISSDLWRLYVATPERRFIYVFAIQTNDSLANPYAHAHLHLRDDVVTLGASGICIDANDRLYAATELGIQTFSHTGHNNTILPLPGNREAVDVAFGEPYTLYVKAADGTIFKRTVKTTAPVLNHVSKPETASF